MSSRSIISMDSHTCVKVFNKTPADRTGFTI